MRILCTRLYLVASSALIQSQESTLVLFPTQPIRAFHLVTWRQRHARILIFLEKKEYPWSGTDVPTPSCRNFSTGFGGLDSGRAIVAVVSPSLPVTCTPRLRRISQRNRSDRSLTSSTSRGRPLLSPWYLALWERWLCLQNQGIRILVTFVRRSSWHSSTLMPFTSEVPVLLRKLYFSSQFSLV